MSEIVSLAGVAVAAIIFWRVTRNPGRPGRRVVRSLMPLWVLMWQLRNQPVPGDGDQLSDAEMHAWLGVMCSYAADPATGGQDIENEPRKGRRR